MSSPLPRRTAKTRPLAGLLVSAGRREAVVVTAHEKRLVINVEADISAIPLARVRRDAGLNLCRTDKADWQIRLDAVPPPGSWVHDLPLQRTASRLRRAVLIVLALLGVLAAGLWAARDELALLAAPLLPYHATDGIGWAYLAELGPLEPGANTGCGYWILSAFAPNPAA